MNHPLPIGAAERMASAPQLPPQPHHHIAILTDAWFPQMNGVVRTLSTTVELLRNQGHTVSVISPDGYPSLPCPTYPEIRLAVTWPGTIGGRLAKLAPDAIHIATEVPLSVAARKYCVRKDVPFTSAYHTQFPAYAARRTHLPESTFWPFIRWFHRPASRIMVATESIRGELRGQCLSQLHHWGRGVDLECFTPNAPPPPEYAALLGPIQLYVGRIAVEKNLEAFLDTKHPGTKVLVGDGPALASLKARYPDAVFLGRRSGRELAGCFAGADVFVFPSKTDTFGLVMIEALACGTPVAAYPVAEPVDILTDDVGSMSDNLERAIAAAVFCRSADCAKHGAQYSWGAATAQFVSGLRAFEAELLTE